MSSRPRFRIADIKHMLARGMYIFALRVKRSPFTSLNLLYLYWCDLNQSAQVVDVAGFSPVVVNAEMHPLRHMINADKHIASLCLIRHLQKFFDDLYMNLLTILKGYFVLLLFPSNCG
ncbi:MAG: hypothetical protein ABIR84_02740 [Candidatus Nitrotoga sp.]